GQLKIQNHHVGLKTARFLQSRLPIEGYSDFMTGCFQQTRDGLTNHLIVIHQKNFAFPYCPGTINAIAPCDSWRSQADDGHFYPKSTSPVGYAFKSDLCSQHVY